MSTYLDDFGAAEARRERLIKTVALIALTLLVIGGALYWMFRDYREERQIRAFIEHLQQGDYKSAYALWGCTENSPCRDYSFEKFIEDWGPEGYGNISAARLTGKDSCEAGIIQTIEFAEGDEILLWVNREDGTISHAPWRGCHPILGDIDTP